MSSYFDFAGNITTPEESRAFDASVDEYTITESPSLIPSEDFTRPRNLGGMNAFLDRVSHEKDILRLQICWARWKQVNSENLTLLSRMTDTCVYMVDRRERSVVSVIFHNWLRRVDDDRMEKAAIRIRSDTERIRHLLATVKHGDRSSDFLTDLLTKLLNHSESQATLSRSFYHWLLRASHKDVRAGFSQTSQPPSVPPSLTATRRGSTTRHLFELPPWPTPFDMTASEPPLPPVITPIYEVPKQASRPSEEALPQPTIPRPVVKALPEATMLRSTTLLVGPPEDKVKVSSEKISLKKVRPPKPPTPTEVLISGGNLSEETRRTLAAIAAGVDEEEAKKKTPLASPSLSSSGSSSGSSSSSSEAPAPAFKLSFTFFMRMRRVCRDWAKRARETVGQRRAQASVEAAVEQAVSTWRPPGVPLDISSQMTLSEAMRVLKEGATMMKRKGAVSQIDVKDKWFGTLKDQERFFVAQIENYDRFILYYGSAKEKANGNEPRGSFSLDELKAAKFSWQYYEIGIISNQKNVANPIMKKISKIPPKFFTAIIICIRYAIGTQARKKASASIMMGKRSYLN